jgi:DNA-binding NtrC family response regulator
MKQLDSAKPNAALKNPPSLIFVVELDRDFREMLGWHLLDEGYEVQRFGNQQAALRGLSDGNPRPVLLITNYGSRAHSGVELINECWKVDPALKVILCSGHPEIPEKITASPARFRFVPKPFPFSFLDFTIESLLGKAIHNSSG